MELLILTHAGTGSVDVRNAAEYHSVPSGHVGRIVGAGESYLGVPYELWRQHVGEKVDVRALQSRVPKAGAPSASRSLLRKGEFWWIGIGWSVFMAGGRAARDVYRAAGTGVPWVEIRSAFVDDFLLVLPIGFIMAWGMMTFSPPRAKRGLAQGSR